MALDATPDLVGRELRDRAAVEDLALDRAALHDHPDITIERVDSCLKQRVDRRRYDNLARPAVLPDHGDHLLDVERVTRRRGGDPVA